MSTFLSKFIAIILAILSIFIPNTPDNNQNENNENDTGYEENYEIFKCELDVYEYENKPVETISFDYAACLSVYKNNNTSHQEFKNKFEEYFGFPPTGNINCEYLGTFIVDGYASPQNIYHYTIEDYTYDLFTDEFYKVFRQICTDGSPWVGFVLPGNLDTMESSERTDALYEEMLDDFTEWTGYSLEYMEEHPESFDVGCFTEPYMRTTDGKVIQVVYRVTRAYGLPIESLENRT